MPGETWWGYLDVATNRIVLTNPRFVIEIWRGKKGLVPVPVFRRPKALGARREYSIYVRNISGKESKESYLDGGIAKEFLIMIRRIIELVNMAGGDVIEFDTKLFPEFIKLNEFISRLRFE